MTPDQLAEVRATLDTSSGWFRSTRQVIEDLLGHIEQQDQRIAALCAMGDEAEAVCWALLRREHPAVVQDLLQVFAGPEVFSGS
jgi:hypothetical protein